MVTQEERERAYELERLKGLRDEKAGRADAFAEGVLHGRIDVLESVLGLEKTPVEQLEALSWEELRRIEAELKAKLANRS